MTVPGQAEPSPTSRSGQENPSHDHHHRHGCQQRQHHRHGHPRRREHGLARLREEECYHLTALVRDALDQAERLTSEVNGRARTATATTAARTGTEPLDRDHAWRRLTEARDCAQVAIDYLYQAIDALRDQDEQPF